MDFHIFPVRLLGRYWCTYCFILLWTKIPLYRQIEEDRKPKLQMMQFVALKSYESFGAKHNETSNVFYLQSYVLL